jgi:predicted acyl esterase
MINLYLPTGPFRSGEAAIRARGMTPGEYKQIVADRGPWDLQQGILWRSLHGSEYDPEYAEASPGAFASGVRAPIHIMHAYQDEQTGPSGVWGVWVWTCVPDDVPKRLVLSNGDHGDVRHFNRERMQWLDFWTIDDGQRDPADFLDPQRRVQVYFETSSESGGTNQPLVARDFPLPGTQWTRYFCAANERLLANPPQAERDGDSLQTAVGRGNDVDGAHYLLEFERATAICGPVTASLWIRCSTIDTDLYVMLADVDAEGTVQMLQRGLLRASHRALDDRRSQRVTVDGQSTLIRPRHTHRDAQPLQPGKAYQLDIEIFPVGHVFREGHQLALWISQPPLGDPVTRDRDGEPAYKYESAMPPATVTILRNKEHASSILLPVLPDLPPITAEPLRPGRQAGIHIRE